MLDQFLKVSYAQQQKNDLRQQMVDAFMNFPKEELHKIACGSLKLADYDEGDWLEKFEGSPLYDQALALEEEKLQLDIQDQQQRLAENQERRAKSEQRDSIWDAQDAIRLKKRLLELELRKGQLGGGEEGEEEPGEAPTAGPEEAPEKLGAVDFFYAQRMGAIRALGEEMKKQAGPTAQQAAAAVREAAQPGLGATAANLLKRLGTRTGAVAASPSALIGAAYGAGESADHPIEGALRGGLGAYGGSLLGGGLGAVGGTLGGGLLGGGLGAAAGGGPGAAIGGGLGAGLGAAGGGLYGAVRGGQKGYNVAMEGLRKKEGKEPKEPKEAPEKQASVKAAAELTMAGRERIKPKNFAIPKGNGPGDTGKYPIQDAAHAKNALTRVDANGTPKEKSQVYSAVARKYPGLAARSSVPAVAKKAKEKDSCMKTAAALLAQDMVRTARSALVKCASGQGQLDEAEAFTILEMAKAASSRMQHGMAFDDLQDFEKVALTASGLWQGVKGGLGAAKNYLGKGVANLRAAPAGARLSTVKDIAQEGLGHATSWAAKNPAAAAALGGGAALGAAGLGYAAG